MRGTYEDAAIQHKDSQVVHHLVFNLLSLGDILIAINGFNVERISFLKKIDMMKQMERPIVLDFLPKTK